MSHYKHLNGLLHKKRIDATAHADKSLFNKSDRAKRERERRDRWNNLFFYYSSYNNDYKDKMKNLKLDRYKWWWMTHGITSTLIRQSEEKKEDGIEILFRMMSEQRCTCSSYVRVYALQFPNGIYDVIHPYT